MIYNLADISDIKAYEQEDSNQIVNASQELIQALVYVNRRGNRELSYTGIQWIAQMMGENGQPLEVVESDIELIKHDPEDKTQWIWYSKAVVRNAGTGSVVIGVSESPFLTWYHEKITGQRVYTHYDEFGRTKAHGKAVRNAMRQLIPVLEIDNMIKNCTEEQMQRLDTEQYRNADSESLDPPTTRQLAYLKALGYTGIKPYSKERASLLIEDIKKR